MSKFSEESGREVEGFEPSAILALQNYSWPGNVRELQNVIERAVLLGKESHICVGDLPTNMTSDISHVDTLPTPRTGRQTLKEALEGPEQIILQVLKENNWNRNETADQLGINRTTLYKKMRKLSLEKAQQQEG